MTAMKCKNCKHWNKFFKNSKTGSCSEITKHVEVGVNTTKVQFETHRTFGCIHFEGAGSGAIGMASCGRCGSHDVVSKVQCMECAAIYGSMLKSS